MLMLEKVSKKLGDFSLHNVNLAVNKGEYFVILGPSGMGKTVLLEIIAGFYHPDRGKVFLNNQDVTNTSPESRKLGFVYQDFMLFPHLSVKDNILFGAIKWFPRQKAQDNMEQLIEMLNIKHLLKRFPRTLSGGEQQRVALARALAMEPEILLLDEPLSALDPESKVYLQLELKRIHELLGTTVVHITHDFNEAISLADRVGVMMHGSIAQIGKVEEVFKKPIDTKIAYFLGMENMIEGQWQDGIFVCNEGLKLKADYTPNGEKFAFFSAQDVIIGHYNGYANKLKGRVSLIIRSRDTVTIEIDIGIKIKAKLSYREYLNMNLTEGCLVDIAIPYDSVGFLAS